MAKHVQKTDLTSQWAIDASNDTWILARQAKISVWLGDGVIENAPYDNSTIRILGDIKVEVGQGAGVGFQGANSSLYVGASSRVDATNGSVGVLMLGENAGLVNDGVVLGDTYGVNATSGAVENNGTIRGAGGVQFTQVGYELVNHGLITGTMQEGVGGQLSGASIVNGREGVIRSLAEAGIETEGTGSGKIENHGLIKAPGTAILDGVGELGIVNTGRIQGSVYMGDGADWIDTRRGSISGEVRGEMGHDTYTIGRSKVEIVEAIGQGYDDVRAATSYTLTSFVEELSLIGDKDINGTGNELGNKMTGNEGRNVLRGMDGADVILGANGNDRLLGGEGVDTFWFATGDNRDVIVDFIDGTDLLRIEDINDVADFLTLEISDVKGGALIEYDGGEIFIKGAAAADITWQGDFAS